MGDSAGPPPAGDDSAGPLPPSPQRNELILEALKIAVATGGEHRLFRLGKHTGLFASRIGLAAEAALAALREGLLETMRTDARGKIVIQWVRATPRAVAFIHENDSPKSILQELKTLLGQTRAGVPLWMAEARQEAANLAAKFEGRAAAMLARLDELTVRVEGALRRAETASPTLPEPVSRVVPWALTALEYLDRRTVSGAVGSCPLPELFEAVRLTGRELTLPVFQNGLRRLHDVRALRLVPAADLHEPEYAMLVDGKMMGAVVR